MTIPTGKTAHTDPFVRDHLPPKDDWPVLLFELPELAYPPQVNVASELLDAHVIAGRGDAPCLVTDTEVWSYGRLYEEANRIAAVLVDELGLVPGNRVLLRAPNTPLMVASWMAVAKAGGIVVATMPLLRRREIELIAQKARVELALCDARLSEEIASVAALTRIVTFEELSRRAKTRPPHFANVATAVDDPVLIAFTSGTTGPPKGCVHFHRDLLASADSFFKRTLPCDAGDVFTGSPPIAFTFGLGMHVVFPMRIGASTVLIEKPSPEAMIESTARHRVSVLSTAPTAYRAMLPLVRSKDLSSLRHCVSAGETLPLPTAQAWEEATGLRAIDGIGSTEMFHIFISAAGKDIRMGATGKPVYGYEARVFDDSLSPLPPGTVGRLGVRGPTGCRYLEDERQKEYVQNGWNFTGDAYLVDEDGYFWFQARVDDMIISAGYNISGPEVEEALLAHDAVADCACVASPDPERGNVVKAFVVLAEGHDPNDSLANELKEFVKARIAPYKYPRKVAFVESLPRTETGKIQRFKLRELESERKGP
ncbi:MAG TPA: AMP-binding protein [Vicinamibacteria bacterium]|nr:AMP-binding protein [Vicinamibacteria bacterium]